MNLVTFQLQSASLSLTYQQADWNVCVETAPLGVSVALLEPSIAFKSFHAIRTFQWVNCWVNFLMSIRWFVLVRLHLLANVFNAFQSLFTELKTFSILLQPFQYISNLFNAFPTVCCRWNLLCSMLNQSNWTVESMESIEPTEINFNKSVGFFSCLKSLYDVKWSWRFFFLF